MTRAEQERMVERYLGGEMNSADEEEFFIQVAIDSDLRQTLKAYRIVESAIRKHRDTAASRHSDTRNRLISMLNAQPGRQPAGGSRPSPFPRSGIADPGQHKRVAVIGTALLRWRFAMVAAIALIIGVYGVAPLINPQEPSPAGAPPVAAIIPAPVAPAPSAQAPVSLPPVVAPATARVETPAVTGKAPTVSEPRIRQSRKSQPALQNRPEVKREKAPASSEKSRTAQEAPQQPLAKADTPLVRKARKRPIISVTDSTIKVRVRVDLPKK